MKILLIGGNFFEQYILDDYFQYQPDFAEEEKEAVLLIKKKKYDGIVINLAYMRVYHCEIADTIRKNGKSKNVKTPMFLLVDSVTEDMEREAIKIGNSVPLRYPLGRKNLDYMNDIIRLSKEKKEKK